MSVVSPYGTCTRPLPSRARFSSASALMTCPRQKSPLLIAMPSRFVVPTACVLSSRSLPARSTKVSLAPASYSTPPDAPAAARHTRTVRIACERLERPFICVSPTVRCSVPR